MKMASDDDDFGVGEALVTFRLRARRLAECYPSDSYGYKKRWRANVRGKV